MENKADSDFCTQVRSALCARVFYVELDARAHLWASRQGGFCETVWNHTDGQTPDFNDHQIGQGDFFMGLGGLSVLEVLAKCYAAKQDNLMKKRTPPCGNSACTYEVEEAAGTLVRRLGVAMADSNGSCSCKIFKLYNGTTIDWGDVFQKFRNGLAHGYNLPGGYGITRCSCKEAFPAISEHLRSVAEPPFHIFREEVHLNVDVLCLSTLRRALEFVNRQFDCKACDTKVVSTLKELLPELNA